MIDDEANHVPSQEEEEEDEEEYYDTKESFEDDDNILRDGKHTFLTIHKIGTTRLSCGTSPVYKASHVDDHGRPLGFVSLIRLNIWETSKWSSLEWKAQLNRLSDHPNILSIQRTFYAPPIHRCATFPLMDLGSIRGILLARFPNGLPEPCILLVLRETLLGLASVHEVGGVHKEVDAGHIFLDSRNGIKLAYQASLFDLDLDREMQHLSYLIPNSISHWAAAPEVVRRPKDYLHEGYSEKSDVWSVGITALELAYGAIKVTSRRELDRMVREISAKGRLPRRSDEMINFSGRITSDDSKHSKVYSRWFECMVAGCLHRNPSKRPSVIELLRCGVFDFLDQSSAYRHQAFDLLRKANHVPSQEEEEDKEEEEEEYYDTKEPLEDDKYKYYDKIVHPLLNHPNIMHVPQNFYSSPIPYCVTFPFMDLGSIRAVLFARFPKGLPEPCILLVLRETLRALAAVHLSGLVHQEVDAGHIFLDSRNGIKLAHQASLFDLDSVRGMIRLSYLNPSSISHWAAAPEVRGPKNYLHDGYSEKSDVWSVGITALELAYGAVKVTSRRELDRMAREISARRRLPRRSDEMINFIGHSKRIIRSGDYSKYSKAYSRGFECMVAGCLQRNPSKRPSVDELLRCGVFDFLDKSSAYRHRVFDLLRS
ncbi:kinase family protein [Striga asiatica]|uniref:Kinase family protein n=1 Tax=Striga asiatica TaxID=4170 RepID=A0A5A7RK40_STRAF|nr:kinase family protein [Striga asiatica]